MAAAQIAFTEQFWPSAYALEGNELKRVIKAFTLLAEDSNHPSLNLHPVHGDGNGTLHTIRASQEIRILLARQGSTFLLDRAGHHDWIYDVARRTRIVLNAGTQVIKVFDIEQIDAETPTIPRFQSTEEEVPGIFDHWGASDLKEAGFGPEEVEALRACATEDDLLLLPWDDESLALVIDLLGQTPEQWRTPTFDPTADAEARFREAIEAGGALTGISRLFTPEELEHLAKAPIEEWMIFLHPDQRAVAERSFDGPARVKGAAGTGKTVVALHRAVHLAGRFAEKSCDLPILFTTYINSLPPVFERLFQRLPGWDRYPVDFVNVDKLARRVCKEAGHTFVTDPAAMDAAFAAACRRVLTPGSPLVKGHVTRRYLKEEISAVLKGRGVRTLDEYLGMERTGRGTRFPAALRHQTWELLDAYEQELANRGTLDFGDVVLRGRDCARARTAPMYRAAIVDEAQDLTLVGLQMVRALVNGPEGQDRPNGLFLVGDAAQKIYAGGFNLRQAGVAVRGRTTVLKINYRNTAEILGAAMAVAGKRHVQDLDEHYARGDAETQTVRSHHVLKPVLVIASSWDDQLRFICEQITSLVGAGAINNGDLAICVATNKLAEQVREGLTFAGIPNQDLAKYAGESNDLVKVGTHFRAKGLEFKVVFLPGLGPDEFPRKPAPGQDALEYQEQTDLAVSQLFVAMTRARDGLFVLGNGKPGPPFDDALAAFDVIDS